MSRKIFAAPIAALALIAAAPVPSAALASANANASEPQANSARSGEAGKPAKAERKICKTFTMTGSHTRSERLCLTRAQWKDFEAAQEEN